MPGRIAADARIEPCAPEPLAHIDETIRTNPIMNLKWNHRHFRHSDIAGEMESLERKCTKKQRTSTSLQRSSTSTSTVDHKSPQPQYESVPQAPDNGTGILASSPPQPSDSGYGSFPQTPSEDIESFSQVDEQLPNRVPSNCAQYPSTRSPGPIKAYQDIADAADAKELAAVLVYLGGPKVFHQTLYLAGCDYPAFNPAGEPCTEGPFRLIPVLEHAGRRESAIKMLQATGIIQSEPGHGYSVPADVRLTIEDNHTATEARQMKVQVSKLVCHTFPLPDRMPAQ
jgi:hypothetical protein